VFSLIKEVIRRYIAEVMRQGTLAENEALRKSYLEYIQVCLVYLLRIVVMLMHIYFIGNIHILTWVSGGIHWKRLFMG
jgi:hypothetical protein